MCRVSTVAAATEVVDFPSIGDMSSVCYNGQTVYQCFAGVGGYEMGVPVCIAIAVDQRPAFVSVATVDDSGQFLSPRPAVH